VKAMKYYIAMPG